MSGSKPKAVPSIDSGAIQNQTDLADRRFASLGSSYNRLNQVDPYGNRLTYMQTGTDANGNPIFSVGQQFGGLAQGYVQGLSGLGQQYFNFAGNPQNTATSQAFQQARDLYANTQEPLLQKQQDQLDTQLRNQGLVPGDAAYDTAMQQFQNQRSTDEQNFLLNSENQLFNQNVTALSPGVQFSNNALGPAYVNAPQVSTGQAYDPTRVANINQQTALANAEAQNQYNSGLWGSLAGLGGSVLGAPINGKGTSVAGSIIGGIGSMLPFSDARLKENIKPVGTLDNGQRVYAYNFKGDPRTQIGLIAQEVALSKPDAVVEHPSGMLMVDYDKAVA